MDSETKYFKDERTYPFLLPLKQHWPTFRRELDAYLGDERLGEKGIFISTSAARAMRTQLELWRVVAFFLHGKSPRETFAELKMQARTAEQNELYEYIHRVHFVETKAILLEYASHREHGIINMFLSHFEPGARLGLHTNYDPYMYRAHLGLRVPSGDVAFKVGDEVTTWAEGELLVFEPVQPHTAWNLTDEVRVVLIVDFFKPEADRAEMEALERQLFQERMKVDPNSWGMSGGMHDLSDEVRARYAVPRIEANLTHRKGS